MPEWLVPASTAGEPITMRILAVRLAIALLLGLVVGLIYRVSHGRGKRDSPVLFATLVLLSILIAMVSVVIGDSVARAFSLVGALSIVRFRTVVDDTRDTAFVILSVVVGMAIGAGQFAMPLVGLPLVAIAAWGLSWWDSPGAETSETSEDDDHAEFEVVIRVGLGRDPQSLLTPVLAPATERLRLRGACTAKQGTAVDVTYRVKMAPGANLPSLVLQLNQLEGVQSVDAREG